MKRTLLTVAVVVALFGFVGAATATPHDDQPQTQTLSETPFEVTIQTPHDGQPQTQSVSASPFDVSIQTPYDDQPQTQSVSASPLDVSTQDCLDNPCWIRG